ncbi:MAG: tRNA 2-thiocytidine(32) synthetase TtcA [Pseudomonadota bacterium]
MKMEQAIRPAHDKEQEVAQTLERKIRKAVGKAVGDFGLIERGDRILVCVSGGKDSYTLLHVLRLLQERAPIRFELQAVNLDPGYLGFQKEVVKEWVENNGVKIHMVDAPIREMVEEKFGPNTAGCPLCARIRRGVFYTLAKKIDCNKLALGHHLDDVIETLLLNLFYSGSMRAMPPLLRRNEPPSVIRPLCYVTEKDITDFASVMGFPVFPCASEHCADSDQRRQVIKGILSGLEKTHPDLKNQMRHALGNIDPKFLWDVRLKK